MAINVAPAATYEAVLNWGVTGLTGTLGVRLLDNAGHTTQVRVTAGIAEYPVGSGVYYVSKTAPGTRGQYTLLWDDGATTPGHVATEDLYVTSTSPTVVSTGSLYVTRDQLKATIGVTSTFSDADVDLACEAASRGIDLAADTIFYPAVETRYYTADYRERALRLGDTVTVDTVTVDRDADGTYEETWTEGTEFFLDPVNAALRGEPYRQLILRHRAFPFDASACFPYYDNAVKVEGTFGWAATPATVLQYAPILAARFIRRARDAPFGFATHGAADAAAFIARNDPDFNILISRLVRTPELV